MRGLIDSHVLNWYVDQDKLLSLASHDAISDPANDLLLSAGSIWEIGIKIGLGKLVLTQPFKPWMSFASKVRNHSWIGSVQGAVATWSTIRVQNPSQILYADHDQVATAPCTDPIQVRILLLRQSPLDESGNF